MVGLLMAIWFFGTIAAIFFIFKPNPKWAVVANRKRAFGLAAAIFLITPVLSTFALPKLTPEQIAAMEAQLEAQKEEREAKRVKDEAKRIEDEAKRAAEEAERKLQEEKEKEAAALENFRIMAVAQFKAAIRESARNPSSIKFDYIGVNDSGSVLCIRYRGENGFGGTSIESYTVLDGKLSESPSDWNRNCVNNSSLKRYY